MNNLVTLWTNPHLRYAALAIGLLQVAEIWLPQYQQQLQSTSKIVTFYALAAAANATPNNPPPPTQPKP
jgi:hypothetical protein